MLIIDLIYNLSVLVALSVLSGFIDNHFDRKTIKGVMFQGLLFGFVAIIGMLYPFNLMPGIIFDGRSIVISLCTLFFGPIAGLLSSLMAIIFRIILGGGGALMGTLVISSSFIIGYYFYYKRTKNKFPLSKINLYLFGVLTSAAMMALMLSLPSAAILTAYKTITFTVMLAYPIISFVIGKILLDQEENRNSIEKIKQEESLFRTTLYSIGDAVITTDNSGLVQHMNPIAENLTGWNESNAKGMKLTDVFKIINEDTRLEVENPVVRVLKEKTLVGLANHTHLISKNGGEKPIADSGAPIIDENGNIIGVVLVFRDQTNERKKEIELKEREEKLQSIFRAAPIGIGVVVNRVFVEINPRMCEMVGYTKEELIGKNSRLLYATQEEYDFVGSEKYKQIASHGTGAVETRFVRKDGRIIDILLASTPIEFDDLSKGVTFTALDISERKRIEAELQSSEEKFRSIVEGAPEPIFIQLNGKFAYVNPAFIELVGAKNSSELIGSSVMERFHPDYHKEILERIKRLNVEKRRVQTTEMKYLRMDGSEVWVETTGEPIVFDGGNGALVFVRNINDRKLASEALKESEEKMRLIIEGSSFFFFYTQDINGDITYISPTVEKITGYKVEEWMNQRHWFTTENPVNENAFKRTHQHLQGKIISEPLYLEIKHKNGSNILLEIFETPIIKNGKVEGLQGIARDITENKQAEKALKESDEKFRFIFENHSAVKLLIEADTGDIYDANFAAEKFYGFSREKLKKMNISQINTLSQEEVQREMQKAVEEKRVQFQFQHKLADGSIRNVEVFSSKVEIAGIKYLHSIIQDITEKMKAEEQLKLYREHLEELVELRTKELNEVNNKLLVEIEKEKEYEMLLKQALENEKEINEIKSRFISTTSHEFRTPLTAVLSSFELIQRYGKKWDEEKYNYHAAKIKNSIEYLTNLLDDVLTISRSESGKIAFEPTNINLKNMCTELIEEAKIHCNEKHRFVYDFEPEQVEFCLDPKLIRFILTNLLTNAVKYSPAGGEIYLNVKSVNDKILLKITDKGIGIPEDEIQYLFEPFHRAKNTTEIQGTGLGLSIVKRSVQIHQGEIKVDSKLGKGTSFTIILPLNKGGR